MKNSEENFPLKYGDIVHFIDDVGNKHRAQFHQISAFREPDLECVIDLLDIDYGDYLFVNRNRIHEYNEWLKETGEPHG